MNGCEVFADDTLVEHDSVLIVVALPRHEGNFEVTAECELALFGRVTLGKMSPRLPADLFDR